MTYRWSAAANYHADWGSIHCRDGRVVKVESSRTGMGDGASARPGGDH